MPIIPKDLRVISYHKELEQHHRPPHCGIHQILNLQSLHNLLILIKQRIHEQIHNMETNVERLHPQLHRLTHMLQLPYILTEPYNISILQRILQRIFQHLNCEVVLDCLDVQVLPYRLEMLVYVVVLAVFGDLFYVLEGFLKGLESSDVVGGLDVGDAQKRLEQLF